MVSQTEPGMLMLSSLLHTTYHSRNVTRNHVRYLNEALVFKALKSYHLNVICIDPFSSFRRIANNRGEWFNNLTN
jgi:hypothetical protein